MKIDYKYLHKIYKKRVNSKIKQSVSFKAALNDIKTHFKNARYSLDYHTYVELSESQDDPITFNTAMFYLGLDIKFCKKRLRLLIKPRKTNA